MSKKDNDFRKPLFGIISFYKNLYTIYYKKNRINQSISKARYNDSIFEELKDSDFIIRYDKTHYSKVVAEVFCEPVCSDFREPSTMFKEKGLSLKEYIEHEKELGIVVQTYKEYKEEKV